MGLMLGMNLDSADRAKAVVGQLLDRGILINRTQDTVLRFLPPYIIQKAHVDLVVRALDAALASTQPKKHLSSDAKSKRRSPIR
jgi:acetylornithine aminotransferase/acetylornithine/N-succinyldiaminopimelate aminotransferase